MAEAAADALLAQEQGVIVFKVVAVSLRPLETFAELVSQYAHQADDLGPVVRISLHNALESGEDPLGILQYLTAQGLRVRILSDLLRINVVDDEEELSAFEVQEGVAISTASDGVWILFCP